MSSNTISIVHAATARAPETRPSAAAPSSSDSAPAKVAADGKALPQASGVAADDPRHLAEAISELKGFVQNIQRNLEFTVDADSGRTVIKVIDSESKEIIRQIPPEEVVQLARNLEFAKEGAILKAKA